MPLQHTAAVYGCDFSHDGKHVITGSMDFNAYLWNSDNGETPVFVLKGHSNIIMYVQFNDNSEKAVTASFDKTAIIWNISTGLAERILRGHDHGLCSAVFSQDGLSVITTAISETTCNIYNLSSDIKTTNVNELDRFENADIPYVFSFQSLTVKILSKTDQILGELELDPQFGLIAA